MLTTTEAAPMTANARQIAQIVGRIGNGDIAMLGLWIRLTRTRVAA